MQGAPDVRVVGVDGRNEGTLKIAYTVVHYVAGLLI